jgi:hypothetical protein
MAPQFSDTFWRFGGSIWRPPHVGGAGFGCHSGGGGLSRGLSPKQKEYSFWPHSPYFHDFSLMFLMLYSPLDTGLLLVLLQPSGYFWLCSSKSSFRGTVAIFKAKPKNF